MLNDGTGFKKVYIAAGFTDLRRGIDGLARIIRFQFHLDPYDKNTLFLFCGKRTDRIKGLLWEGDGFLLLNITVRRSRQSGVAGSSAIIRFSLASYTAVLLKVWKMTWMPLKMQWPMIIVMVL